MPDQSHADQIELLTQLIAAHGVYALTMIWLFLVWGRMRKTLEATPSGGDHEYYKKCHTATLLASAVFFVASSAVWFYATFVYKHPLPIRGSIIGLAEQKLPPTKADDPAYVLEQIVPEVRDIDLFEKHIRESRSGKQDVYDLDWIVLPQDRALTTLSLLFQHDYKVWTPRPQDVSPRTRDRSRSSEGKSIRKHFKLDMAALKYEPESSVQILYEPDGSDSIRNVGHLFLSRNGKRSKVEWEFDDYAVPHTARTQTVPSLLSGVFATALAAGATRRLPFATDGSYEPQIGRRLREQLGSLDLQTQLDAYNTLVTARARAFKFIADSLSSFDERLSGNYDHQTLVNNLARAVLEIERNGDRAPDVVNVSLASAFVTSQNYRDAVRFFERASNSSLKDNALFERGLAYAQTREYQKALADYQQYLANARTPTSRAVAETNIGWVYRRMGDVQSAISHYRGAMRADQSYARAYNNLAYLYAEDGTNLAEALKLVDRALALNHELDDVPNYKDTKAWILYKSGRSDEALGLLKEAVAASPYDPDIRLHLETVAKGLRVK